MRKSIELHTLTVLVSMLLPLAAMADGGAAVGYSPYSKFGLGNLHNGQSTISSAMGGVGVANRNHSYINILNPAAVTARDTLSFMAEVGVSQGNSYYMQRRADGNQVNSVYNTFNMNNIVMSFPIWKSSAFMVGINPFSNIGYDFQSRLSDPGVIGVTGPVSDSYNGTGGLYQIYVGAGVTFWKRLSIGAQFDYYFGTIEKAMMRNFTSSEYRTFYNGSQMRLNGFSGKVGLQYEQPVGHGRLTFGATFRIPTKLGGSATEMSYAIQNSVTDSLRTRQIPLEGVRIPEEYAVGLSYRYTDMLMVEFDYSRSDWNKSGMATTIGFSNDGFDTRVSQSFRLGMELTPNRSDIRSYMKRATYRAGLYYGDEYYSFGGRKIFNAGVTIGATFPVFRWLNGISLAADFGRRGAMDMTPNPVVSPVRELYINFKVSFNIFDIWFVKPKYE